MLQRDNGTFLDSIRMTSLDQKTAGSVVTRYQSDFGTVDFLLDRNMPADSVLVLDESRIGFGPLTDHAMQAYPIPDTTKSKKVMQIWAQYTSELRNENAHAKITGLATS